METPLEQSASFTGIPKKLPNATLTLVLSILSILGCCCFYGLAGLALAIVSLVLANKDIALYNTNPQAYEAASYSNVKAAKIISIVGIALAALMIIMIIVAGFAIGWEALNDPEELKRRLEELQGK